MEYLRPRSVLASRRPAISPYRCGTRRTGSVSIANGIGTFSQTAVCGWMITGAASSKPTANVFANNYTSQHSDPQSLGRLTVNASGVGVAMIAGLFHSGTDELPTSWTNATRDATTESANTNGNGYTIAGAHEASGGTYSI
jgi:hypothetical protein